LAWPALLPVLKRPHIGAKVALRDVEPEVNLFLKDIEWYVRLYAGASPARRDGEKRNGTQNSISVHHVMRKIRVPPSRGSRGTWRGRELGHAVIWFPTGFVALGAGPGSREPAGTLVARARALLRKIETWWIVNFETPINPDLEEAEIAEAGIVPGPSLVLQLMTEIALGPPEKSRAFLNEFRKRVPKGSEGGET
jgi:hypothetical protein